MSSGSQLHLQGQDTQHIHVQTYIYYTCTHTHLCTKVRQVHLYLSLLVPYQQTLGLQLWFSKQRANPLKGGLTFPVTSTTQAKPLPKLSVRFSYLVHMFLLLVFTTASTFSFVLGHLCNQPVKRNHWEPRRVSGLERPLRATGLDFQLTTSVSPIPGRIQCPLLASTEN